VATPIPEESMLHDWWFALCAKYFGILDYIDVPLVNYRQHGANAIGVISAEKQRSFFHYQFYQSVMRFPKHLSQAMLQAKCLRQRIEDLSGVDQHQNFADITFFADLSSSAVSTRLGAINRVFGTNRPRLEKFYLAVVLCLMKSRPAE
jgi:hypothetical protein